MFSIFDSDTLQVKRTSSWNKACEELKRYQKQWEKLRDETDNFTKPFVDSSSDESDVPDVENYEKIGAKKTVKKERVVEPEKDELDSEPEKDELDSEPEEEKEEVVEKKVLPSPKNNSLLKLTIVSFHLKCSLLAYSYRKNSMPCGFYSQI